MQRAWSLAPDHRAIKTLSAIAGPEKEFNAFDRILIVVSPIIKTTTQ